ncbi:MAG: dephospho-CoA kinase [Gammaproteobacteria bacterium]|nr:dephospho-CoA kinase [Gammaproteobacteria bacterium]
MSQKTRSVPLAVGLTGGIATGKSTVADMFAELGVPVIDTDDIARDVVAPGEPGLAEIAAEFGAEVLQPNGELDRARLRQLVFADPERRHRLEGILHPRIRAETVARAAATTGPYLIIVVPLLVESGFDQLVDRALVVDCPEAEQRRRLLRRDAESESQAEKMMAAQTSRAARLAAADDVIDNSGSLEDARAQVERLHQHYLALARDMAKAR